MIKGDSVRIRTGSGSDMDVTRKSISAILSKGDSKDVEPEVDKKVSKELPKDNSKDTGAKK
jgi:preprotein translocase subunit YajC